MREEKKSINQKVTQKYFLSIVFKIPVNKKYTYYFAGDKPPLYCRVSCDFSGRTQVGMIVDYPQEKEFPFEVKSINCLIDEKPLLGKEQYALAQWLGNYYFSSLGEALSLFVPFTKALPSKQKADKKKTVDAKSIKLNQSQSAILKEIIYSEKTFHLIHGVTGSGKTHLYLALIEYCLARGEQVLLLLPEIALTPQTWGFFESHLPQEKVEIIHSKVAVGKKLRIYRQFSEGEIQILIGTRSLIFVSAHTLGAIIIDEEHESTYKNNSNPRYHARQVAQMISNRTGAKLVLGSATPSLDIYHLALKGKIKLHTLKHRYSQVPLPRSRLVFKREANAPGEKRIIDETIYEHLKILKANKRQAIVYLNKRGYSAYVRCFDCNLVYKCHRCEVTYTYHKEKKRLICHYCGERQSFFNTCRRCHSENVGYIGHGTEKVMEELLEVLPAVKFARVDSDVLSTPNKIKQTFLDFKKNKIDILVGTQILTKGHDFPNLLSVVILNPEMVLALPDFRSAEKTFNQITQVSGRAGRRGLQGEVYIQTWPEPHFSITCGQEQNYLNFYRQEIARRREFLYPPFVKLFRMVIRSKLAAVANKKANALGYAIKEMGDMGSEVLGPAPCVLAKVDRYYRWNIIFKIHNYQLFKKKMDEISSHFKVDKSFYIEYDMDPYDMY